VAFITTGNLMISAGNTSTYQWNLTGFTAATIIPVPFLDSSSSDGGFDFLSYDSQQVRIRNSGVQYRIRVRHLGESGFIRFRLAIVTFGEIV
jgi:hypothetical protein